jgi:hypothetical protein
MTRAPFKVTLDSIAPKNMKKFFALLRNVLPGAAFAVVLFFVLLHQAPKRQSNPAEFAPISYHPYVTHSVGDAGTHNVGDAKPRHAS